MAGEKTVKRCLFAVVELGMGGGPSDFIVKQSPSLGQILAKNIAYPLFVQILSVSTDKKHVTF